MNLPLASASRQDFFISCISDRPGDISIDYNCEELCKLAERLVKISPFDSALSLVKDSMRAVVDQICICSTIPRIQDFIIVHFRDQLYHFKRGVAILGLIHGELSANFFRYLTSSHC
jgi:hypothetical protein